MPSVRPCLPEDIGAVVAIVRGLPEYFSDDVPGQVERDAASHDAWVLTDAGTVAGFAVVARKSALAAEIRWMAVAHGKRGHGLGTAILDHVLDHLSADGVRLIEVKTLDRSAPYPPYEATRAFWERNGFIQVDSVDPFPEWQAGNPAAIYVAALRPTR